MFISLGSVFLNIILNGDWNADSNEWLNTGRKNRTAIVVGKNINLKQLEMKIWEKIKVVCYGYELELSYAPTSKDEPFTVGDDNDFEAFKFVNMLKGQDLWHTTIETSFKKVNRGGKKRRVNDLEAGVRCDVPTIEMNGSGDRRGYTDVQTTKNRSLVTCTPVKNHNRNNVKWMELSNNDSEHEKVNVDKSPTPNGDFNSIDTPILLTDVPTGQLHTDLEGWGIREGRVDVHQFSDGDMGPYLAGMEGDDSENRVEEDDEDHEEEGEGIVEGCKPENTHAGVDHAEERHNGPT